MKKIIVSLIVLLASTQVVLGQIQYKERFKPFTVELGLGPRVPLGVTKDDITTGLAFNLGVGYRLNKTFELANLGIDFGNSSPHNPSSIVVQDYYSYYGRLAMETVSVIGIPLTTRIHFPISEFFNAYVGGGISYYWFSARMDDVIYGSLQEPRRRNGFGPLAQAAVYTNLFSDEWLIMLKFDYLYMKSNGKSLSIREGVDPTRKFDRDDKYLTISVGLRYYLRSRR